VSVVREKLIKAGVRNLKEFGYEHVDDKNILTDVVYSQFFLSMLKDNLGHGFDSEINHLIQEIG
jgi:hypothetical protein